jgi:hypothetical protein
MMTEFRRCQIAEWVCNGLLGAGVIALLIFIALGWTG